MPEANVVRYKKSEKPGKIAFSILALDALLSIALLAMGLYMFALGISRSTSMLVLPAVLFVSIGGYKAAKLYPILMASIGSEGQPVTVLHNSVLVPISRPETLESHVNLGCDMVAPGGTLRLLYVIEVPQQVPFDYADTRKAKARELLTLAASYAEKRGVMPKLEIVAARVIPEAILELADRYKVDLIIMGSSQRTVPEKVLFGNVVDRVLREAPCEALIFSYSKTLQPIKYYKILVPTSGYKHAERALDIAIHLTKKFGGKITSLYVGQASDAEKAKLILKKAQMHAERLGSSVETLFKTGSVIDNIIDEAKSGSYSLIIIGSTERPAYYTFLLGSTADEIVTRAPCNVLIVHTKK
ncbi:MAG TPA: universal stress protein [Methanocella sp.]|uniref:universal stress protein n=1 Tax=Methanocella sp. TaxID=2052833 RepID=UPI002B8051D4|nr:universal stress protein [Methanocella sp.]HTY91138.1 universal stress protein [Methanocella sp.]